jgi:hypothetical protein
MQARIFKMVLALHGARFPFEFLILLRNFEFTCFKKFQKEYQDVENVVLYQYVNFQNDISCILGLPKIINFTIAKLSFHCMVHQGQNLNMSFSLSLKYNIFCSENLPTDEIQHCLHHGMLLEFFEMFEFEILRLQNLTYM